MLYWLISKKLWAGRGVAVSEIRRTSGVTLFLNSATPLITHTKVDEAEEMLQNS